MKCSLLMSPHDTIGCDLHLLVLHVGMAAQHFAQQQNEEHRPLWPFRFDSWINFSKQQRLVMFVSAAATPPPR